MFCGRKHILGTFPESSGGPTWIPQHVQDTRRGHEEGSLRQNSIQTKQAGCLPDFRQCACMLNRFSHVQLFVISWMQPTRLLCPQDSPGRTLERVAMPSSRRSSRLNPHLPHLLHWQMGSLSLALPGRPRVRQTKVQILALLFPTVQRPA